MLAVTLCLLWSSAFVFMKLGLRDAAPASLAALRAVSAVPVLLVALLLRDRHGLATSLRDRRVHVFGLLIGMVLVAGFGGLTTLGFVFGGIGFGAVLIYTQPLLVAAAARVVLSERLRGRQVAGLLTGWAGVVLAVLGAASNGAAATSVWPAVPIFLGAALCFAIGTIAVKSVTSGPRTVALPPALLLGFAYGSVPLLALGQLEVPVVWTWRLVLCVAYSGALALAGGYLLQFALLERGDASVVSSYIFAVPVLTAGLGVVVFAEPVTPSLVLGACAVAAGILLVTLPSRIPQPPP